MKRGLTESFKEFKQRRSEFKAHVKKLKKGRFIWKAKCFPNSFDPKDQRYLNPENNMGTFVHGINKFINQ